MNTFIGSPLDQVANGVVRGILRVDLAPGRVGMRDVIQAGCKVHRNNLVVVLTLNDERAFQVCCRVIEYKTTRSPSGENLGDPKGQGRLTVNLPEAGSLRRDGVYRQVLRVFPSISIVVTSPPRVDIRRKDNPFSSV